MRKAFETKKKAPAQKPNPLLQDIERQNASRKAFSQPAPPPNPKPNKEFLDAMSLKEADGPYAPGKRPIVFKRQPASTKLDKKAQVKEAVRRANLEGKPVDIGDGIYYPDGSAPEVLGDFDGSEKGQSAIDRYFATGGYKRDIAMDGIGGGTAAVGSKIGGGKAASKGASMVLGAPGKMARKAFSAAMRLTGHGSPEIDKLDDLEQSVRSYESGTGRNYYEDVQAKSEAAKERVDSVIDRTLGKLGLGVGPVAGFLAKGAADAVLGSGRAQLELMDSNTDPETKAKAGFAYGQGLATLGGAAAMAPGAGNEIAHSVASADVLQPAIDGVLGAGGRALKSIGVPEALAGAAKSFDNFVLSHGLNRPILDALSSESYDTARQELIAAGVSKETAAAYAQVAAARTKKLGDASWLPEFKGDPNLESRGEIQIPDSGRPQATLGKFADASTPGHEMFHGIRNSLTPEEQVHFDRVLGSGEWNAGKEEEFAKMGEKYLGAGQAPTPSMDTAFRHLGREISGVYGPGFSDGAADLGGMFRGRGKSSAALQRMETALAQGIKIPRSDDPRLDQFTDEYDDHYRILIDRAFGDPKVPHSGQKGLAELEQQLDEIHQSHENYKANHEEEMGHLLQQSDQLDLQSQSLKELLQDADSILPKKRVKTDEERLADAANAEKRKTENAKNRGAGLKVGGNRAEGGSGSWVMMKRNKLNRWVPMPTSPELVDVYFTDVGGNFPELVQRLKSEVEGMDEGAVFVPWDQVYGPNKLYTKGVPPTNLNGYQSRGRLSELMFGNIHEDDISTNSGNHEKQWVTVPKRAVERMVSRLRSEIRSAEVNAKTLRDEGVTKLKAFKEQVSQFDSEMHQHHVDMATRLKESEKHFAPTREEGSSTLQDAIEQVQKKRWRKNPTAETSIGVNAKWTEQLRDTLVSNLTTLKRASRRAFSAAVSVGSARAEANLIMKKAAEEIDKVGGTGAFQSLIPDLTISRFVGIFDRWQRLGHNLADMDDVKLAISINSGDFDPILQNINAGEEIRGVAKKSLEVGPGSRVRLDDGRIGLIAENPRSDRFIVQLKDGSSVVLDRPPTPINFVADLKKVKELLAGAIEDARQNVGLLIAGGGTRNAHFDPEVHDEAAIRSIVESERERLGEVAVKKADVIEAYKKYFVPAVQDIHARNEGVSTTDLGPLDAYIPLSPNSKGEAELIPLSDRERLQYNRPENPRNTFATGLATDYDMTMERLSDALRDSTKENSKAHLMDELRSAGLLVDASAAKAEDAPVKIIGGFQDKPTLVYADGSEVPATWVDLSYDRYDTDAFSRPKKVQAKKAAIPAWLEEELVPILKPNTTPQNILIRALHKINFVGALGGSDAYYHSVNVLNTLRTGLPYVSDHRVGQLLELIPGVGATTRWFTTIVKVSRTNASDERAMADLAEMAKAGCLPNRYGNETYSSAYAQSTGAELKGFGNMRSRVRTAFGNGGGGIAGAWDATKEAGGSLSLSPLLTGPSGLDTRARLIMWRSAKALNPKAEPYELAEFVNQLGAYNKALESKVERFLKEKGVAPFFTAGSTMIRNGIRTWTGRTKFPMRGLSKGKRAEYWIAQQMSGGAAGALVTWAMISKAVTDKFPWEDKESQLFQIPIPDDIRYSDAGKAIWGKKPGRAYLNMAFFLGSPERGARALGIKGAYDTYALGGDRRQMAEYALYGVGNSFAHPIASSPSMQLGFEALLGAEPYLLSARNEKGQWGYLNPVPATASVAPKTPFGQQMFNVGMSFLDVNQMLSGTVRLATKGMNHGRGLIPQTYFERQKEEDQTAAATVLAYTFPRAFTPPRDLARRRGMIRKERKAVERSVEKDN